MITDAGREAVRGEGGGSVTALAADVSKLLK